MSKDDKPLKMKMKVATICKLCKNKCIVRLVAGDMVYCPTFEEKEKDGRTNRT